ncbi:MAG: hypothetical protein IPN69_23300 [Acidobacteria bacterium]|nr:hypothetical protein [Acidobacteriota bacterium]
MLGSPRVITDSEGNVIARRDFKPFGEEISSNTGERTITAKYGAADNLRQKFTTYQRDEETGLDFAEARMYENRHGRFTAVDPLLGSGKSANPQTFNRFVYCLNSQSSCVDPTGLFGDWYVKQHPKSKNEKSKLYEYKDETPNEEEGYTLVDFGDSEYFKIEAAQDYDSGDNLGVVYLKKGVNETLTQEQYDAAIQGQTPVAGVFGSFGIARGGLSPTFLPSSFTPRKGINLNFPQNEQCGGIIDLVTEESRNGTYGAARKYSVTFGTQRRLGLDNRVTGDLPDGKGGRIDQDWWMDLASQRPELMDRSRFFNGLRLIYSMSLARVSGLPQISFMDGEVHMHFPTQIPGSGPQ